MRSPPVLLGTEVPSLPRSPPLDRTAAIVTSMAKEVVMEKIALFDSHLWRGSSLEMRELFMDLWKSSSRMVLA